MKPHRHIESSFKTGSQTHFSSCVSSENCRLTNKEMDIAFRHFDRSREIFQQEIKPIFKNFSPANNRDFAALEMTTDLRKNDMFLGIQNDKNHSKYLIFTINY